MPCSASHMPCSSGERDCATGQPAHPGDAETLLHAPVPTPGGRRPPRVRTPAGGVHQQHVEPDAGATAPVRMLGQHDRAGREQPGALPRGRGRRRHGPGRGAPSPPPARAARPARPRWSTSPAAVRSRRASTVQAVLHQRGAGRRLRRHAAGVGRPAARLLHLRHPVSFPPRDVTGNGGRPPGSKAMRHRRAVLLLILAAHGGAAAARSAVRRRHRAASAGHGGGAGDAACGRVGGGRRGRGPRPCWRWWRRSRPVWAVWAMLLQYDGRQPRGALLGTGGRRRRRGVTPRPVRAGRAAAHRRAQCRRARHAAHAGGVVSRGRPPAMGRPAGAGDPCRRGRRAGNARPGRRHHGAGGPPAPAARCRDVLRARTAQPLAEGATLVNPVLGQTLRAVAAAGANAIMHAPDRGRDRHRRAGVASKGACSPPTTWPPTPPTAAPAPCIAYRDRLVCAAGAPAAPACRRWRALALLERFEMAALDPAGPQVASLLIQAERLAAADRDRFLARPGLRAPSRRCSTRPPSASAAAPSTRRTRR